MIDLDRQKKIYFSSGIRNLSLVLYIWYFCVYNASADAKEAFEFSKKSSNTKKGKRRKLIFWSIYLFYD